MTFFVKIISHHLLMMLYSISKKCIKECHTKFNTRSISDQGYLNDPEATERTIDKEGWLHTGDIGYIDDDDELFIVDRLKELIKYKGFQVAPAELEALLVTHPQIFDAAVVPMKDEGAGEVPVAFVVTSSGFTTTEDEIKKFISKQVIFYKRINRVFFVDSIPKSPSGKILRKDLRAKLADMYPNGPTTKVVPNDVTTKDVPNSVSMEGLIIANGGVAGDEIANGAPTNAPDGVAN